MRICLFGSSSTELEESFYDAAFRLGSEMAERGHSLIFGGGECGLMGACVRGLEAEGGRSIGVAPRFFDTPGILHKGCSEFIFTDTMRERKQIMEDRADAFIVVPGGVGTYEEFFEVLTLNQLGQMNKPIAIFNVNGYYDVLEELLKQMKEKGFLKKSCDGMYGIFSDIGELMEYMETQPLGK